MRNKTRANLNQALACLSRVHEDLTRSTLPLQIEEWYTLAGIGVYVGEINGLHHKLIKKDAAQIATNPG